MLSLSTLHTTLAHILAPPHLHTAILFTTSGQLISYASDAHNSSFNNNNNYPDSSNSSFTSNTANSTSNSPSSTLKPKSPTKSTSSTSSASEAEQGDADSNADMIGVGVTGGALGGSAVSGGIVGEDAIGGKRVAVSRGSRSKDDIRVLVGLGSELWGETKGAGVGMVDSELGRIVVVPILALPSAPSASALPSTAPPPPTDNPTPTDDTITEKKDAPDAPLMLLALNGTDDVSWDKMRSKAKSLATHLAPPLSKYREYLVVAHPPLPLANGVVPPGGSSVSATGGGGGGGRMVVGGRI